LIIMLLFGSVIFGFVISQVIGSVLFVKRIGAEFLPYTYILNAIFGASIGIFFSTRVSKVRTTTLIKSLSLIGVLGFLMLYFGVNANFTPSYTVLVVFSYLLYLLLMTVLIWDVALKLCTPF